MNKQIIILVFTCVMALSGMASIYKAIVPADNMIAKQIGAGPAGIIMMADSMVANLTVWENEKLPPKVLPPCMCSIVQYSLCQPIMYSTDIRVYSAFYADVSLVIYKGNSSLILELDYNINKWRLIDDKGNQLCRHDLRNSELLTMIHELWPESKNITIKYEKFTD